MGNHLISLSAAAALTLAVIAPASAATTLNANWNTDCAATTCFDQHGVFTQTFSASDFTGPVTVDQLLMQRGVLGALDSHLFNLSFALNGQEVGTWGNYNMAAIHGDQLSFTGETFTWNPADGDLVLVLTLAPPLPIGLGGFHSSGALGDPPGDVPGAGPDSNPDGDPDLDFEGGDLSSFVSGGSAQIDITAPVPEPAGWALMIGGFGLIGAALRRRRAADATAPLGLAPGL